MFNRTTLYILIAALAAGLTFEAGMIPGGAGSPGFEGRSPCPARYNRAP